MLRNTCAACGGVLQRGANNTAVCMKCFRTYSLDAYQFNAPAPRMTANPAFQKKPANKKEMDDATRGLVIFLLVIGSIVTLGCGMIPLTIAMIVGIVNIAKNAPAPEPQKKVHYIPCGEYLKQATDYTRVLREMPIGTMPLGIYAEKAALQIERMNRKQKGLVEMLGSNHPFVKSGLDAEKYILANCKKVIWRLKYCDQTEPSLCRIHAEFLESVLADNEKVLHDYDMLLMEVTQMQDNDPLPEPTLDILADSLKAMRTGEPQPVQMNMMM